MKNKHYIEIPRIRIPIWPPNLSGNWRAWLPSRGNVLFTLLVISALFWAQSAGALPLPAPTAPNTSTGTIAYQGRLADSAGTPLTGTYSMIFRIYNAAIGSAPLWSEQWTGPNSVQVSDGLFNVMLGSMAPISQTMITSNSDLWLGITVGADNEMLPRVQLGTVPFAMQALTVPDGSITQAKLAPDVNLLPPAGSITTTMLANGAVTAAKLAPNTLLVFNASTTQSYWQPPHCDLNSYPVPGLSISMTVDAPGRLLVDFTGLGGNFAAGASIYTSVFVDNVEVKTAQGSPLLGGCDSSGGSNPYCTLANSTAQSLNPGNHTVEIRVMCGGSAYALVHSGWLRAMFVP